MDRVRKFRIFIIGIIICAIASCIALISVSYAKWSGGGILSACSEGSIGQFYVNYPKEQESSAVVRQVTATTEAVGDGDNIEYVYRNYICISRVGATDDGSIAFVEFFVEGINTDLKNVKVKSIALTRYSTDDDGTLSGGTLMTPRLYGIENVSTLADINSEVVTVTDEDENKDKYNMVDNYNTGGIFSILYFSSLSKYYAMEITITTESTATFNLKASVSNTNYWQRYKEGYGEPGGFYLGGRINTVNNWNPRYTTHMVVEEKSESTITTTDSILCPSEIKVTLTINLTAGSQIKMYMLNDEYNRREPEEGKSSKTIYFIPRTIVYPQELQINEYDDVDMASESDGADFNVQITKGGEYKLTFSGSVSYQGYEDNGTRTTLYTHATTTDIGNGTLMKNYSVASGTGSDPEHIPEYNCVIDKLTIEFADQAVDDDDDIHTVSFVNDKTGVVTIPSVKVANGETFTPPMEIGTNRSGYILMGYYIDHEYKSEYDFDRPVTDNTVIYVKWEKRENWYIVGIGDEWNTVSGDYLLDIVTYSITLTLNNGEKFKIAKAAADGIKTDWSVSYGYKNLADNRLSFITSDTDGNIVFTESGKYEISFDGSQISIKKIEDILSDHCLVYNTESGGQIKIYVEGCSHVYMWDIIDTTRKYTGAFPGMDITDGVRLTDTLPDDVYIIFSIGSAQNQTNNLKLQKTSDNTSSSYEFNGFKITVIGATLTQVG